MRAASEGRQSLVSDDNPRGSAADDRSAQRIRPPSRRNDEDDDTGLPIRPAAAARIVSDDEPAFSPDPNPSQRTRNEKKSTTQKGGGNTRGSLEDEKFAAKASRPSEQDAAVPGALAISSLKQPQKSLPDEKFSAKASRSNKQETAVPGAVAIASLKQPHHGKSLKRSSSQPELVPDDSDQKLPAKKSRKKQTKEKQSKDHASEPNTSVDIQSTTGESILQPANDPTTATRRRFRPRPPVDTTTPGAVAVPGIGGPTSDQHRVAMPSIVEGRNSLPVAEIADDTDEVYLDLDEAEPLSEQDLKNQGVMGWIQQHKLCTAVAVLIVIGAIVGGAVGATLGGSSTPASPTLAPTASPTAAPTLSGFEQVVDTLTTITPYSVLTDPTTPQNAAVTWIMREDEYDLDFNDSPKLLQRYALATIYFATVGANWTRQLQFMTNQDDCLWNGVVGDATFGVRECNEQGLATKLALSRNGLQGTLPEEIVGMPLLTQFGAAFNNGLNGTIPQGLTALTNLVEIYLFECGMSGMLPQDIGSLSKLTHLALQKNALEGTIPLSLYELTVLENLFLTRNSLSGTLPTLLGNLISLKFLWLEGNELSGSIPTDVARMTSLVNIYMNDNDFTGGMDNFCTPSIDLAIYQSDCFDDGGVIAPEPKVECYCCTACCFHQEFNGGCVPNDGGFTPPSR